MHVCHSNDDVLVLKKNGLIPLTENYKTAQLKLTLKSLWLSNLGSQGNNHYEINIFVQKHSA